MPRLANGTGATVQRPVHGTPMAGGGGRRVGGRWLGTASRPGPVRLAVPDRCGFRPRTGTPSGPGPKSLSAGTGALQSAHSYLSRTSVGRRRGEAGGAGGVVTRFQKLALATVATALLLVTIGVVVRATGSGLGCPDWPFCHGRLIPAPDDTKAWIEWVHRLVAMVLGLEVVALAAVAAWDHRRQGSIFWPSLVAVGLVVFQAYLGKVTVDELNSGETVTAHL